MLTRVCHWSYLDVGKINSAHSHCLSLRFILILLFNLCLGLKLYWKQKSCEAHLVTTHSISCIRALPPVYPSKKCSLLCIQLFFYRKLSVYCYDPKEQVGSLRYWTVMCQSWVVWCGCLQMSPMKLWHWNLSSHLLMMACFNFHHTHTRMHALYKELRLCGYEYQGLFCGFVSADIYGG